MKAEAMFNGGVRDIYISNEVVDPRKLKRVALLSKQCKLSIVVDSTEGLKRLSEALTEENSSIRVLVDLDIGHGRCGTTLEGALDLIQKIKSNGHMEFAGIHAYHGSAQHVRNFEERKGVVAEAAKKVKHAKTVIEEKYGESLFVTGGGTGTMCADVLQGMLQCEWGTWRAKETMRLKGTTKMRRVRRVRRVRREQIPIFVGVWNELQPGSYLFGDVDYGLNDWGPGYLFEQSFFIRAQVMSASANHVVIDAGNKCHSLDAGVGPKFAAPYEYLSWRSGGDEHGIVFLNSGESGKALPKIGDFLDLIPGHIDPTVNMYDAFYGYRDDTVTEIIEFDARGRAD
jgi:D-serine deaminase-like pyridoxal phosphate-dependent protein